MDADQHAERAVAGHCRVVGSGRGCCWRPGRLVAFRGRWCDVGERDTFRLRRCQLDVQGGLVLRRWCQMARGSREPAAARLERRRIDVGDIRHSESVEDGGGLAGRLHDLGGRQWRPAVAVRVRQAAVATSVATSVAGLLEHAWAAQHVPRPNDSDRRLLPRRGP